MKTNPNLKVVAVVLTLAVFPTVAFAQPAQTEVTPAPAVHRIPTTVEHMRTTLPNEAAPTTVRFNLIDGQPIR